jgi:hypothetical protein
MTITEQSDGKIIKVLLANGQLERLFILLEENNRLLQQHSAASLD